MTYTITITGQQFLESEYEYNCALSKALRARFPDAYKINVGPRYFEITMKDYSTPVLIFFKHCTLLNPEDFKDDILLEDLIYDQHDCEDPQDVTFSFETVLIKE